MEVERSAQFPAAFDLLGEWLQLVRPVEGEAELFLAHNAPFDLRVMLKALSHADISFTGNWEFDETQNHQRMPSLPPQLRSWKAGRLAGLYQQANPSVCL